jgi:hypothetical protein
MAGARPRSPSSTARSTSPLWPTVFAQSLRSVSHEWRRPMIESDYLWFSITHLRQLLSIA